jgi:hypothetical protein
MSSNTKLAPGTNYGRAVPRANGTEAVGAADAVVVRALHEHLERG